MRLRDLLVPYKGRQHARLRVASMRDRLLVVALHGRAHHVDASREEVHVPEAVEVDDDVEGPVGSHGGCAWLLWEACASRAARLGGSGSWAAPPRRRVQP